MEQSDYLKAIRAFGGNLSPTEQKHLSELPDIRFTPDGKPAMVLPPPLQGNTHDEKLADFARRFMFDDREATPEEISAWMNGGKVATPQIQAPVNEADPWEADGAPEVPATDQSPTPEPISDDEADKLKSVLNTINSAEQPAEAPTDEAPVRLPPGHTFVKFLDDGRIVAMFKDPSYPRSPAREVVLPNPAKVRGKAAEFARRAALWARTAEPKSDGRTVSR